MAQFRLRRFEQARQTLTIALCEFVFQTLTEIVH
jgi:hypothetical protein